MTRQNTQLLQRPSEQRHDLAERLALQARKDGYVDLDFARAQLREAADRFLAPTARTA